LEKHSDGGIHLNETTRNFADLRVRVQNLEGDLPRLSGRAVWLLFELKDADLFALRFG